MRLLALGLILLTACYVPVVRRTAIDYEARTLTLCGNEMASQRDFDREAAQVSCNNGRLAPLRCGSSERYAGTTTVGNSPDAIINVRSTKVNTAVTTCCDYACRDLAPSASATMSQ